MERSIFRSANKALRAAFAGVLFIAPSVAFAQDHAGAEELFQLGKAAMARKEVAQACDYFKASLDADFALGTLLNLATCYEQAGKVASAWAAYRQLEDRSRRAKPPQKDRAEYAHAHAEALYLRLSRVRIVIAPDTKGAPDLVVKIDAAVAHPGLYESGIPVDIGKHTVTATAASRAPASLTVSVDEDKATVDATISLQLAPVEKPVAQREPTTSSGANRGPVADRSSRRTLGLVVGGGGLVALAAGAVFGGLAASAFNDAACGSCVRGSPELTDAKDTYHRANAFAWVSNVTIGLGAIGLGVGTFLFVTAPSGAASARSLRVGVAPGGLTIGGTL